MSMFYDFLKVFTKRQIFIKRFVEALSLMTYSFLAIIDSIFLW